MLCSHALGSVPGKGCQCGDRWKTHGCAFPNDVSLQDIRGASGENVLSKMHPSMSIAGSADGVNNGDSWCVYALCCYRPVESIIIRWNTLTCSIDRIHGI